MHATFYHRLLAVTSSAAAFMPSATVHADAYVAPHHSAEFARKMMKEDAAPVTTQLSRKELFEKRRLLRENQADAEAAQVRNMLMVLAVLRSQQNPASLSIASVR